jgi:hypothetical protein
LFGIIVIATKAWVKNNTDEIVATTESLVCSHFVRVTFEDADLFEILKINELFTNIVVNIIIKAQENPYNTSLLRIVLVNDGFVVVTFILQTL